MLVQDARPGYPQDRQPYWPSLFDKLGGSSSCGGLIADYYLTWLSSLPVTHRPALVHDDHGEPVNLCVSALTRDLVRHCLPASFNELMRAGALTARGMHCSCKCSFWLIAMRLHSCRWLLQCSCWAAAADNISEPAGDIPEPAGDIPQPDGDRPAGKARSSCTSG